MIRLSTPAAGDITLTLQFDAVGSIDINWGDGSVVESITTTANTDISISHTKAISGSVDITFTGTPNLTKLGLSHNEITNLSLTEYASVIDLDCSNNPLGQSDIEGIITFLTVSAQTNGLLNAYSCTGSSNVTNVAGLEANNWNVIIHTPWVSKLNIKPTEDLSDVSVALTISDPTFFQACDTDDGSKLRVRLLNGRELAFDPVKFDRSSNILILEVMIDGILSSSLSSVVEVYPALSSRSSYTSTSTYGRDNAYESDSSCILNLQSGVYIDRSGISTVVASAPANVDYDSEGAWIGTHSSRSKLTATGHGLTTQYTAVLNAFGGWGQYECPFYNGSSERIYGLSSGFRVYSGGSYRSYSTSLIDEIQSLILSIGVTGEQEVLVDGIRHEASGVAPQFTGTDIVFPDSANSMHLGRIQFYNTVKSLPWKVFKHSQYNIADAWSGFKPKGITQRIKLTAPMSQELTLTLQFDAVKACTIDWGDGSPVENVTTTANTDMVFNHTKQTSGLVDIQFHTDSLLTHLSVSNNNITAIDIENLTGITLCNFSNNSLVNFDLAENTGLLNIEISNNPIEAVMLDTIIGVVASHGLIGGRFRALNCKGSYLAERIGELWDNNWDAEIAPMLIKDNIRWSFDKPLSLVETVDTYHYGTYANGDYWVKGTVNIIGIYPKPVNTGVDPEDIVRNGSMINPPAGDIQSYDSRTPEFSDTLLIGLNVSGTTPLVLVQGQSLVSTASAPETTTSPIAFMQSACILNCVENSPALNTFRPGYAHSSAPKSTTTTDGLNWGLLQNLEHPPHAPSFTTLATNLSGVWLDHKRGWTSRGIHPLDNMPNYGADMANIISQTALAVHLTGSQVEKEQMVINFIQLGLDLFWITQNGGESLWEPDGGHCAGRKWPIIFAGLMLDVDEMKNIGSGDGTGSVWFQEDAQTFYVTQGDVDITHVANETNGPTVDYVSTDIGTPEWGIRHSTYPEQDNKAWYATYRNCCTARHWAGFVLAARIMEARDLWNHNALFDYQDRFMLQDLSEIQSNTEFFHEMWKAHRISVSSPVILRRIMELNNG